MIRFFSSDPAVIAVGAEYLRLIAWGTVASRHHVRERQHVPGDGQHDSAAHRLVHAHSACVAIPAILLSRMPGFELRWIWYLSVGATILQLAMNLLLLRREFRLRLAF